MKVPLRWLQEMIDLPTTEVQELRLVLDMLGHKVEGVEVLDVTWTEVYVGRVTSIAPHPDADRIRVCQVDSGLGADQIICGAWNFEEGAAVAVARPGANLPGGHEIGRRTIRGVESNGMICSERELGLGEDHEGILVLDDAPPNGTPFEDLIELPDVVLDLETTPNRPDAMSILGVARDLAAHYDIEYRTPEVDLRPLDRSTQLEVMVQDPLGCRRFTLREIVDVDIGRSPLWMRHRLAKVGVRPVSNVVDVTNYVMFELGHPLHAFDADTVVGDRLEVRRASEGETLVTLDHIGRSLSTDDLIIYDQSGPTSMSGTMGGARSEVGASTRRVLMEAASWDPPTIMFMSRRHDLRSEASLRFERGVDPGLADLANRRASALVATIAGGSVLSGAIDVIAADITPVVIDLSTDDVERILGKGFDASLVTSYLRRLGMAVEGEAPMRVTVPTFRPDVTRPIDLVEEVARLHGYDRFDASLPSGPSGGLTTEQRRGRLLAAALAGAGLDQAITLPFVSAGDLALFGSDVDDVLRVKNPLREEESRLRPTLLPGLLNAVVYNLSHGAASVALFETGSVFHTASATWDARLPEQPERLGWVINGGFGDRILGQPPRDADVTTSLGVWALLTDALGVDSEVRAATTTGFHPARTAEVTVGGTVIGHIGELSPLIARRYGIDGRVAIAELELTPLLAPAPPSKAKSPSVFPHVEYDLSFNVGDGLPAGEVMRVTRAAAGDLLESAVVFDEFLGLGPGNRAIAIRYRLRAADRTLTADEIGKIRASMIEAAAAAGATLRGA